MSATLSDPVSIHAEHGKITVLDTVHPERPIMLIASDIADRFAALGLTPSQARSLGEALLALAERTQS